MSRSSASSLSTFCSCQQRSTTQPTTQIPSSSSTINAHQHNTSHSTTNTSTTNYHGKLTDLDNEAEIFYAWCAASTYIILVLFGILPDPFVWIENIAAYLREWIRPSEAPTTPPSTALMSSDANMPDDGMYWSPWGPMDTPPLNGLLPPLEGDAGRFRWMVKESARKEAERNAFLDGLLESGEYDVADLYPTSRCETTEGSNSGKAQDEEKTQVEEEQRQAEVEKARSMAKDRAYEAEQAWMKTHLGWNDADARAEQEREEQERQHQEAEERAKYSETPEERQRRLDHFSSIFR